MAKLKKRRGLSILELAFSVAILGLIIIFIIGMYSTFFTSGTKLNEENIANFLALSYINRYSLYANSEDENLRQIVRNLVNNIADANYQANFGLYTSQFVGRRIFTIQVAGRQIYGGDVSDQIQVIVGVYWLGERTQQQGSIIRGYGRTGVILRKTLNVPR
ncbi:MAG: hypothetical protein ACK4GR_04670 [bacterium]